jgi:hypothetical protein
MTNTKPPTAQEFCKVRERVYIIESPDPNDLLDGRMEGKAMASALGLANVAHQYFLAVNAETVTECFERIEEDIKGASIDSEFTVIPTIHLSAHGSPEGVELTNGEQLDWETLRQELLDLAQECGLTSSTGLTYVSLSMSSCHGAEASRMFDLGAPYPCTGIVAPSETISWSEALTGFVAFYHLCHEKELQVPDAVKGMNAASGTKLFRFYLPKDLQQRRSAGSFEVQRVFETQHWQRPDGSDNPSA